MYFVLLYSAFNTLYISLTDIFSKSVYTVKPFLTTKYNQNNKEEFNEKI